MTNEERGLMEALHCLLLEVDSSIVEDIQARAGAALTSAERRGWEGGAEAACKWLALPENKRPTFPTYKEADDE